ncbi:MAG: ArsR family transcriptional regulator [Flavobacteriales bacterium]|nr:helix-turn-helix transcriptional regulator [Bacteroidales bacterium AH-315-I05]PCJ86771.1 MAG: ArsR family transcriptional regulator [Flavobacteriales bacterium]
MPDKMIYQLHADVCKALAHAIRIEIIDMLGESELGFREISEKTSVAKSSLSQHLSVMVEKGILTQRKEGLNSYFKLSTPKVAEACQLMREVLIERLEKTQDLLKTL